MIGKKVLLIDDDLDFLKLTCLVFQDAGAQAFTARDGLEGMGKLFTHQPDLIILDVMMPGADGFQVCERIRQYSNTPLIMLTALGDDENMLKGLDAGADDFLSKPINRDVLLARSRAVLRRGEREAGFQDITSYTDGHLEVDLEKHRVLVDEEQVKLTPVEFRMLAFLVSNAGRVVSFDQILLNVWGSEYRGNDDYVHVYVSHLRSKIEQDSKNPEYIVSIHGVGYVFEKREFTEKKGLSNNRVVSTLGEQALENA